MMKIIKVDVKNNAEALFALDNKAFHRAFDLPSRDVQEQVYFFRGCDVFILYNAQISIGFFALKKDENGIEIVSIVVTPKKQGKGYGKAMMDKISRLTKGSALHLVTHPKNIGAIIFYLKFGFEIYGWKDNYYGDGQPRLLLKRTTEAKLL